MEEKKITFRLDGCLYIVLLSALCGIAINECKRSQMRLNQDKTKYEQAMKQSAINDSIARIR